MIENVSISATDDSQETKIKVGGVEIKTARKCCVVMEASEPVIAHIELVPELMEVERCLGVLTTAIGDKTYQLVDTELYDIRPKQVT